jgi:hypothetical protein
MELIVETYPNPGEPSSRAVRVRPVDSQLTEFRVSCSVALRTAWKVGQRFKIEVQWVYAENRKPYLRMLEEHGWTPL